MTMPFPHRGQALPSIESSIFCGSLGFSTFDFLVEVRFLAGSSSVTVTRRLVLSLKTLCLNLAGKACAVLAFILAMHQNANIRRVACFHRELLGGVLAVDIFVDRLHVLAVDIDLGIQRAAVGEVQRVHTAALYLRADTVDAPAIVGSVKIEQ